VAYTLYFLISSGGTTVHHNIDEGSTSYRIFLNGTLNNLHSENRPCSLVVNSESDDSDNKSWIRFMEMESNDKEFVGLITVPASVLENLNVQVSSVDKSKRLSVSIDIVEELPECSINVDKFLSTIEASGEQIAINNVGFTLSGDWN